MNIVYTTEDTGGKLGTERIPNAIFDFTTIRAINTDTLFTVN